MTACSLIENLERAGFQFRLEGEKVLVSPESGIGSDMLADLRARKSEIATELRRRESPDLADGEVLEELREPVAWKLYSRLLGRELWLCRDPRVRDEIAAQHAGVPVLLLSEVPKLRGKPAEVLRAIMETKATFPDAELQA